MMILISGQPGNGKTLRALALMVEEYERNRDAVKAGKEQPREFFTNIAGVTFDWVKPIPFAESAETRLQQRKPDWRLCPDGAFVVYDEAHADGNTEGLEHYGVLFPGTGRPGESDDPRIRAMSTHRHRGFDLVFVTQWPNKIHHNVRTLVGKHLHMNRALGLQRAGVLSWTRVQPDPYDEKARDKAEEEVWVYPVDLFDKYRSATLHTRTYKFQIPKRVWGALSSVAMLLLLVWLGVAYFTPDKALAASSDQPTAAQGKGSLLPAAPQAVGAVRYASANEYAAMMKPRIPHMPWTAPAFDGREVVAEPRVFCVLAGPGLDANGERQGHSCRCRTEQGTPYKVPDGVCRVVALEGEPYNPFRKPDDRRREAGGSPAAAGDGGGVAPPVTPVGVGVAGAEGQQARYGAFRG